MDDGDAKKEVTGWKTTMCTRSILIRLVSWSVLDSSTLKFGFDVFWNASLDSHGVHASHVLGWAEGISDDRQVRGMHLTYMFSASEPPNWILGR